MSRFRIAILVFILSSVFSSGLQAQCSQFPADCPSDRQLPDSADRLSNPLIPAEVSMEIRMHETLSRMMQELAEKKQWEVYQFDESDGSGYLNAARTGPLEPNLRPPHEYEIAFVFIVNKDSLQAWRDWDNAWVVKIQEETEKIKTSGSGFEGIKKMQSEKKVVDERFRNASMIRVKIDINPESAIASSITENLHQTGSPGVSHALVSQQWHNNVTDEHVIFDLDQFKRCTDLVFILMGEWNPKPDQNQRYHPQYAANSKTTDHATPNSIPSDRVRAIAMHVEGSPGYMQQFLQSLNMEGLNNLITRK